MIVDGNSHETSQEQDDLHVGDMDDKVSELVNSVVVLVTNLLLNISLSC